LDTLAPKASPTFTGTPAAPTAAGGTSTTQIATTAFVQQELGTFDADDVTFDPTGLAIITAVEVQTALEELDAAVDAGGAPSGAAGGVLDGTYPNPGLAASVAGAGLTETTNVLSVNVDGSTLEIDTDTLRVKDLGVSTAKIAADAVTYAKIQDISATSRILGRKTAAAGDTEECTLSEVLDFIGSAAQGDILYRGAASWARLGAGTNGHFLQTQGAGANPQWAAAGGGSLTVGTSAIGSGAAGRVLYETSGNVLGEISTLTSDGTIVTLAATVTTGSGSTAGLAATANSLTTGNAFDFSSSSVTSGNVVSISSTSTAAASNTQTALSVATSGANGTATQTTFAGRFNNTHTGSTSTNIGLQGAASGGTVNWDIVIGDGTQATAILASSLSGAGDPAITFSNGAFQFRPSGGATVVQYMDTAVLALGSTIALGWDGTGSADGSPDTTIVRKAAAVVRAAGVGTAAGSVLIGTNSGSIGTSGVSVLAMEIGTAPSSSPANEFQMYSLDWNGAGTAAAHFRNEEGHIIKLARVATYTPTNVSADRSYDANATTLDEIADCLGTLIGDLQTLGFLG
jgi:hypothetical protein